MRNNHDVVAVLKCSRGCRKVWRIKLNGEMLRGCFVRTFRKGQEIREMRHPSGKSLDHYNPEWLAHRNGRTVNLEGHPSMREAEAHAASAKAVAEAA